MRIFVTGCCGFIGSVLCDILTQRDEYYVVGMDNLTYDDCRRSILHLLGRRNFKFIEGCALADIHNHPADLKESNVVIPLAAIVGAPACDKNPRRAWNINAHAVDAIRWELREYPNVRIILPNTNSGYGTTDGSREVVESDLLEPISEYGKSKCKGETYALKHANTVVFRLATVFGSSSRMRFDLMVNDFFAKLFYNRNIEIFEPHFLRNFVHVRDVCRAFIHAFHPSFRPGVYNLGLPSGNMSKWTLALRIANYLSLPATAITQGTGIDPDQRNYQVSNAKLLSTGFRFRYELEDGLDELSKVCLMNSLAAIKKMGNV